MSREGSSEPSVPASDPAPVTTELKALLKESLRELLQETPSLLQPPTETQQGKLVETSTI